MKKHFTISLIFWLSFILFGLAVKILHLLSSAFIIIGFSGLMAYLLHKIFFEKKNSKLFFSLTLLGVIFLVLLFWSAYLNNEYPINKFGVYIYFIVLPIIFIFYLIKHLIVKVRKEN